jgi:glycosyltransferase involved in cell wall biosynthesis
MKKIKIAIDGSRNRSGGAKIHLIEILKNLDIEKHEIDKIHLWSYSELLDEIPNYEWLVKHNPFKTKTSILNEMLWQNREFPKILKKEKIDIVFNTTASTVCNFQPSVTLSQDMLSYEKGIMKKSGFTVARLRLLALKYIQKRSLKNSSGAIFLTNYASDTIQRFTGRIKNFKIINHGIPDIFRNKEKRTINKKSVKLIYVSNIDFYKNQWNVVKALDGLNNLNIELILAGGPGSGSPGVEAKKLTEKAILDIDPKMNIIKNLGHIDHKKLPELLKSADIFIFASSCENMPVTLVEGMASGLPILCSDRGPMPEVLQDGGLYFDPDNVQSIANAIKKMILDDNLRKLLTEKSFKLSEKYTWEKCSYETFSFVIDTFKTNKKNGV